MPITSICDGNVPESEYYTHVQTGCDGLVGPTLSFAWVKPPPDGTCVLPANVTVDECSWSDPWSAPLVAFLFAVAPLPVLLILIALIVMDVQDGNVDCTATNKERRGKMGTDTSVMSRRLNLLAYLLVWLGIASHTVAVPFVHVTSESGEVSEDTCIARWIAVVVSSALVFLGITLRVGEEMAAEERDNSTIIQRPRLRQAYATAAFLNFLAVIVSSVAVLTFTENSPATVNGSETVVVMVDDYFQEFALQVTRCRSTAELTAGQFWGVYAPWGLMHLLGLVVHCERMRRGLRISRYPTLLTLLLHSVLAIVMMKETTPEAQTFFVRTLLGIALGWVTLVSEVVWPTYQKYVRRQPNDDTLFVVPKDDPGGDEVRFSSMLNGSEKAHHLFISYKWKTSYDKVHSLEPQ